MPNVVLPGPGKMAWFNPGATLGPRQALANQNDTPPTVQLTGYIGGSFLTPIDPFGGVNPGANPPVTAVIVPVFPHDTTMRCTLVWKDDIVGVHVVDIRDGLAVLWIREDAITRNVEFVTPTIREERFLEGRISELIAAGSVSTPASSSPRRHDATPTTWGSDCPGSVKRSFCGTPC